MDKIPPETRAIYEFLRADFDVVLAKTASERNEATVSALAKLDGKLDLLSGRIDDVKLSIDVDLDELRGDIGADHITHVASSSAPVSPREP
ncbi:hypothetical protein D1007_37339 [Hordeum vulgare]|nr:hypothetical protein D1007_37339 [Hordeum vulgare]